MNVIKHAFKERIYLSVKIRKRIQKPMKKEKEFFGSTGALENPPRAGAHPSLQHPNQRFRRASSTQTTSKRLA
jgi:hypothetical protein